MERAVSLIFAAADVRRLKINSGRLAAMGHQISASSRRLVTTQ